MTTLHDSILLANSVVRAWNAEEVRRTLECIVGQLPGAEADWDGETEGWGFVYLAPKAVAYVCSRIPLVIVAKRYLAQTEACLGAASVVIFPVEDFDEHLHTVSEALLQQIFRKRLTPVVSYEALSINDLYYATVS